MNTDTFKQLLANNGISKESIDSQFMNEWTECFLDDAEERNLQEGDHLFLKMDSYDKESGRPCSDDRIRVVIAVTKDGDVIEYEDEIPDGSESVIMENEGIRIIPHNLIFAIAKIEIGMDYCSQYNDPVFRIVIWH